MYVRRVNLDGYERFGYRVENQVESRRRALTAEAAFSVFAIEKEIQNGSREAMEADVIRTTAWEEAVTRLGKYSGEGLDIGATISAEEANDVTNLRNALTIFFRRHTNVTPRPHFRGCGYIDNSYADVIADNTLYEVKTVDRPFRGSDLRQLLTYAALNLSSGQFNIRHLGLLNPRRGIFYRVEPDALCLGVSGSRAQELLSEIISTVSGAGISG